MVQCGVVRSIKVHKRAPVIETHNPLVLGSNPSGPTTVFDSSKGPVERSRSRVPSSVNRLDGVGRLTSNPGVGATLNHATLVEGLRRLGLEAPMHIMVHA